MREFRQPAPQGLNLSAVERLGRDQHLPIADFQPGRNRLGAEGGKQRCHDAFRLQRAEHRDIELGNPAQQQEHAPALSDAEHAERIGKAVRLGGEDAIGDVAAIAGFPDPAQRNPVGVGAICMPIHRLVRDIQTSPARQSLQKPARLAPIEHYPRCGIVDEVRTAPEPREILDDRWPGHEDIIHGEHSASGRSGAFSPA